MVEAGGVRRRAAECWAGPWSRAGSTSRCASRGCGRRRSTAPRDVEQLRRAFRDPSRARPRATIAPAPGGRPRARGSRRRRRRPRGRSCRSSRSLRDRSAAPFRAAGRGSGRRSLRLPCVPCEAVQTVALSALHVGDRAGRADRAVALHRPEIAGGERLGVVRAWRAGVPLLTSVSSAEAGIGAQRCGQRCPAPAGRCLRSIAPSARGRRAPPSIRRRRRPRADP